MVYLVQPSVCMWWNLALDTQLLEKPLRYTYDMDIINDYCLKYKSSLSMGQIKICQYYVDHMSYIARGSKLAIIECQHQFKNEHWNCSTVSNETVYGNVIQNYASRESAYVHAISTAGVLQSIARSCRNGDLHSCGCSKTKRPDSLNKDYVWGGCGDNIEYAYKFTKEFIDLIDQATNIHLQKEGKLTRMEARRLRARKLVNLHNNEAGRRIIYKMAKIECKCLGLSGSCTLKTCWLKLPSFREIGDKLKEKFERAIQVRYDPKRNSLRIRSRRYRRPTSEDLIYIDESPNYCVANQNIDILGTKGRQCNKNSNGPDGCNQMCCGRGYYVKKTIKSEKCKCKFQWCCEVKCETCITEIETYICK